METKSFVPGDAVKIQTKNRIWEGHVLQSYDSDIILLKLPNGYNIGIRENEIMNASLISSSYNQKNSDEIKIHGSVIGRKTDLPNVAIIITGGTISSRLDPKSGGTIPTDIESILNIAPDLKKICNPILVSPFMKFSEDMCPKDWKKIAEVCEKYLKDDSISGIIITHGTDTLHYTGAALSFFIQNLNKPIALTYSQRSIDRASTDAALNLICAARYSVSDIAEVALIGHKNSNDEVCLAMPATKVRKMHTSRRDAFKVINDSPLAEITKNKITFLKKFNTRSKSKPKLNTNFQEKIASIKIYPGIDPSILDYYKEHGYRGIIIETTGLGHVPGKDAIKNWLPKIKKLTQNGITVCATAQTIYGRLNPNVYSAGRYLQKTGIIFLKDMLSETAFVKLGWVLGNKKWNIKEKMLENISNEFASHLNACEKK